MGELNMSKRYDELRKKEEAYETIVAKFGSIENALNAINEEDVLKFYYCESEDKYLVGQRVDTSYYAEVCKTGLNFRWSRHLPWGEHFVAPNTLWKEHTYPSEPKEIDFFDWLQGYIKQIDKAETVDAVPVVHGEWIKGDLGEWQCSICREENCYAYSEELKRFTDLYCPACGAKMDGKKVQE